MTTRQDLPFVAMPYADLSLHEPYRGGAVFGKENKRLLEARSYHLTGDGGDALFDPEPFAPLADLLLQGEYNLARSIAIHIGRAALCNPETILERARQKIDATLSSSYERVARQLTSNSLSAPSRDWLPALGIASSWLTPLMREAVAARASELAKRSSQISFSAYMTKQTLRDSGDAHRHLRMLAERLNVRTVAPYLNETVLRGIIALPASLRIRPGQFKPLLQAASNAANLAPPELFTRRGKGTYSEEFRAGLTAALSDINERLDNLRLAGLGIVDPVMVRASLSDKRLLWASLTQLLASEAWLEYLGVEAPQKRAAVMRQASSAAPAETIKQLPAQAYVIPDSLRISSGSNGELVAFDEEQGQFKIIERLNGPARLILRTLAETHSPQLTLDALQSQYPNVPIARLSNDLIAMIDNFVALGWLHAVDPAHIQMKKLASLNLPDSMNGRILTYLQTLNEYTLIDAHHFASAVMGEPTDMLTANNRAADIVRNGVAISPKDLALGAYGVIGVLKSTHGLTHGLHSVIGLGGDNCLSIVARQGNLAITSVTSFLDYYKQWLQSIDFAGDARKVCLYVKS